MDKINLDELKRLAAQATPGPWKNIIDPDFEDHDCQMITNRQINHVASFIKESNAAYIVAACNAVPELIARIRELERQREFFLKALKANSLCPTRGCFDGSEFDEWDCTAANNRECWIKAAEEAGE